MANVPRKADGRLLPIGPLAGPRCPQAKFSSRGRELPSRHHLLRLATVHTVDLDVEGRDPGEIWHLSNQAAADSDALLLKIDIMCRRCVELVERSRVRIARGGQLVAESNRRTNATEAVRAPIRAANIKRELISDLIKHPQSLLERVRQTRATSELIFRRTREVVARSRAHD